MLRRTSPLARLKLLVGPALRAAPSAEAEHDVACKAIAGLEHGRMPTDDAPVVVDNFRTIREHFAEGRSVCPFAVSSVVSYARDSDPLAPLLEGLAQRTAAVIVAERTPSGFAATRAWAFETFMAAVAAATMVSHPTFVGPARDEAIAQVQISLHDDASPIRPMIGLRDRALVTICMAPVYPRPHPRYAPAAALVLVHVEDVDGIELPTVRRAMRAQHGWLYDANELMLPLPATSSPA